MYKSFSSLLSLHHALRSIAACKYKLFHKLQSSIFTKVCYFLPDTISAKNWGVLHNTLLTTGILGIAGIWKGKKRRKNGEKRDNYHFDISTTWYVQSHFLLVLMVHSAWPTIFKSVLPIPTLNPTGHKKRPQ